MVNSTLAVVVTSSSAMLKTRGMWILSTYGLRVPTFVITDDSTIARRTTHGRACHTIGELTLCKWTSVSFVVLVRSCGGLEKHGCCRVFRFLHGTPLQHDWVAFVDDDVYVPKCIASYLPIISSPLFAPSKHVGARGGWRWSLCGDKGRPDTEIALPAGYGFANHAFVSKLAQQAPSMIRQCAATPAYNFDVSLSFASWKQGVNLTAVFDWTDPRVNWMGGQRHLWREKSWIYHKVRTRIDFETLDRRRSRMCGMAHDKVKALFAEQRSQTGYKRTRHSFTPALRYQPFDCQ